MSRALAAAKLQNMSIQPAGKAGKAAAKIAAKITGQSGAKTAPALPPEAPPEAAFTITATQPAGPPRGLKYGDTFVVLDIRGDIGTSFVGSSGLFHDDTRHLSRLEVLLNGKPPLLLGSNIRDDNTAYQRLGLRNYADQPIDLRLTILFDNDFADLFEVRGAQRERRGVAHAAVE